MKCFRVAGKNRVGQVTGNNYIFSFSLMMINNDIGLGQSFIIFRFTDPPEPIFLEIEKK